MLTAEQVIELLDLQPHPSEGGFYRETYRSRTPLSGEQLPGGSSGPHVLSTAIYFLLTPETVSAMHRLPGDEMFHFYAGDPVEMLHLYPDGRSETIIHGSDLLAGQQPQVLVPGGVWQGARLVPGGAFALLGTTMAPGFEFDDFATGDRAELTTRFPSCADLIAELTP